MEKLRIEEAIKIYEEKNGRFYKNKLAAKLWTVSNRFALTSNICNLISGRTKVIRFEWIKIICDELDCDPNFLFGYDKKEDENQNESQNENIENI